MKKIVNFFGAPTEIFRTLNDKAGAYARSLGMEYQWQIQDPFQQSDVIRSLREADAGIIDIEPYGEEIFSRLGGRTKLLIRFGVGYDKVDLAAATRRHIAVARTTGANTDAVAEMALSLLLSAKRHICIDNDMVRAGKWEKDVVHELIGSCVGIVGFGAIGKRLAKLLQGFDCKILAYDPFPDQEAAARYGVAFADLDSLLSEADAVSLHVPLTGETKGMISHAQLDRMKPWSVIVNTSRGGIIDEEALYEALKNRTIGGAGIDVFAQEPLPAASPLRTLDNVILTPHNSSQTEEALWNIYKMAIDICKDYFDRGTSPHILNPEANER